MTWHKGITTLSVIAFAVAGPIIAFAVVGPMAVSSREALAQSAVDQGSGLAQPAQQAGAPAPLVDEPSTPTSTGTVSPGMTREQVMAVWGEPVVERSAGAWTYLFFRNGCEVSCGTFDVVFLQDGQVVDAIVRGEGHTYAGVSSSPAGRGTGGGVRGV